MKSFGTVLDENRGVGRGFDTLRVALSLSIVLFHSVGVSLGPDGNRYTWAGPAGPLCAALLPAFFALSGFLVMGSALRTTSLGGFIGLRALRIVPALATEITLSALILGPLLTTVTLPAYFGDQRFLEYFGSLIGRIRTSLPGVFDTNPDSGLVNVSLWTVRPELGCYVYLAIILLLGRIRNVRFLAAITGLMLLANVVADATVRHQGSIVEVLPDRLLLLAFAAGNLAYVFRYRLPYHPVLCAAGLLACYFTIGQAVLGAVSVVLLTYCTAWLGLAPLPRIPLARRGDYSYGIYLYGYPVQQSVSYLFPGLRTPAWNLLLSLPVILALAAVSWHVIEKRALRLRRLLPKVQSEPALRQPGWSLLLVTLLLYEAYLNLSVLALPPEISAKVGAVLIGAAVLFGALCLVATRLMVSQRRSRPLC